MRKASSKRSLFLKAAAVVLMISGAVMIFYPQIKLSQEKASQRELTEGWKRQLLKMEQPPLQGKRPPENAQQAETANGEELTEPVQIGSDVFAMLKIDAIDLYLPIIRGATAANLNITLTVLEPVCDLTKPGNLAVAGHNYYEYGRGFNRIYELRAKDVIVLETKDGNIEYSVTDVFKVNPSEVSVLESDGEQKIITLITCYPLSDFSRRLIVQATAIN